jgi:sulfoxide reductase heme-binding subunit YedZ
MSPRTRRFLIKLPVFLVCLPPLAYLISAARTNRHGANQIKTSCEETGTWTLRFLAVTLAITPIRRWAGWNLQRFRRMFGLFAFFYGTLHFLTYVWLDQFFVMSDILKDIAKRPFITMGFAAFVLMVPLAFTSTTGWIRRLGRRWQTLHRLIYGSAIGGVIHYWWLVKADTSRPFRYGVIVAILLAARLAWSWRTARAVAVRPAVPTEGVPR